MIILTLAVHVFCEHAIEINADTGHCSECIHIYVYGSHRQKISVLYIKHTCSFWGGGEGFKRNEAFSFFSKNQ